MLSAIFALVYTMFTNKRFLICFGVILVWFIPTFVNFEFDVILSILLLIVIIILAMVATAMLSAVLAVTHVAVSYARAKKLAEEFPQVAEMERQRGRMTLINIIFFIAAIPLVALGIYIGQEQGAYAALALVVAVYILVVVKKERALRASFKQLTVFDALAQAFEHIEYDAHGCFPREEIRDLNLIQGFDIMRGNDWIKAERKGIPFCRSDIHVQQEHTTEDSNGKKTTSYTTTFEGSVIRFEQQQEHPTRLVVITEGFPNVRSRLAENFKKLTGRADDSSIETELDAFNRVFDAYSSDQVAARMIMTPQMMEGMLRQQNYTQHQLAFVFEGKFIYLFISTPDVDSFELSISSHKSVKEQQKVVAEQVSHIAGLIDNMYFKEAGSIENSQSSSGVAPAI